MNFYEKFASNEYKQNLHTIFIMKIASKLIFILWPFFNRLHLTNLHIDEGIGNVEEWRMFDCWSRLST